MKPTPFDTPVLAHCFLVALLLCFPASPACAADLPAPPSVRANGPDNKVVVTFSKPVKLVGTYSEASLGALPKDYGANHTIVILTTPSALVADTLYTLTIAGEVGEDGTALVPDPGTVPFNFGYGGICVDFSGTTAPAGTTIASMSTTLPGDGTLHLNEAVNVAYGAFIISNRTAGLALDRLNASFKSYLGDGTCSPNFADGYSFNWASDLPDGPGSGEEGDGSGLSLCFDTWDNGGGDDAPALEVKWQRIIVPGGHKHMDLRSADWVDVSLNLDQNGKIDVYFGGQLIFDQLQIPNYKPIVNGRFGFYSRTGGANENQWIKDLCINVFPAVTVGLGVFSVQPGAQTVTELQPANFRFVVDGTPPFTFQWFKNGAAIAGATNPVYTWPAAALSDSSAVFTVVASNPFGSVTSSNAVLTVTPDLAPPALVRVRSLTLEQLEVSFSKPVSQATATNLANFAITNWSGSLTLANVVLDASQTRVLLTTSRQVENLEYTLTVNGIRDTTAAGNLMVTNSQMTFTPYNGVLTRKVFFGIPGNLLENLTNDTRFPNQPDLVEYVSSFETPADITNYYGVQLKGYVEPPVSGDYIFYLCSDDQGALFLSTDADPANKRLIASEPQWNGARQWINGANQASRGTPPVNISAPIHLDGGGKYYIEALMKEHEGGDNLSVAWQMPGDPAPNDGGSPIPGQYLSSAVTVGPVVFAVQPGAQTVAELQPANFRFEVDGTPPFTFQWFKNGAAIGGATNPVYTWPAAAVSDSSAVFTVVVSNPFGSVTSSNAVLTVTPDLALPTLVRVRSLTLEQVEVTFSKPLSESTATNLANFVITNASGALTLSNAVLVSDQTSVLLTTSRQNENTNYTLTVNGVRDTTAGSNLIAANSQVTFTPYFPDEFVGPFPSWGDVKRDYGAVGDGVADDTAALQRALDDLGYDFRHFDGLSHPFVLYLPAGTYRITQGLNLVARPAVSIMGEDPANTIIRWDGPAYGVMILLNGFTLASMGRLTFDGAGRALSAVDQKWDGAGGGGCAAAGIKYADLVLKDVQFGIRGGNWDYQDMDGFVAVLRCRFLRCSKAGLSLESFNASDWWVWHSVFEDCRLGVCNTYGAGMADVHESVFRRSTESDIAMGLAAHFFIYQNYSIGSRAFLLTGFNGVNMEITLQGNTILDPQEMPISGHVLGPLVLIDNVIRSRPGATGPVAEAGHDANYQGDLVSIGNTFTVANALRVTGRLYAQDDVVVNRDAVNPPEPELPGTLPNLHRPVFEVPIDADAAAIQQVIDTAAQLNGQRPVVHLPGRYYRINRPLVIPAGCDLQLVGDSFYFGTTLEWTGTNATTMLRLAGPSRATLREFRLVDWTKQTAGISIDGCDQPGARIFGEQIMMPGLLADRLDHARVELRDIEALYSEKQRIAVRVIGGPLKGSGQQTEGRVNIFSGESGYGGSVYDLQNGGQLLVRDMYYEGHPQRFLRLTGSGTFTLHSGRCSVDPVANPVIEFKDFHGQASLVSLELINTDVRITGGGEDTRVLGLGLGYTLPNGFVNDSPNAQVALLGSRSGYNGVPMVSAPNYTNQIGSVPEFVRQMLAQTRGEHPQPLTHLPDGVTDVRMYRVTADGGCVGLQLNRDHQATIITQPQSQTAVELHSAAFAVTPAGPVPYSLQWFRNGVAITEATNITCVIPSVALSDSGATFSVMVSNEWNSVTSSNAVLTVTPDTTPAQAVLVASYEPGWIVASFDEGLDPVSATDTNHYTLSDDAFVTGAYLRSDGKSVLLRVAGPLETNFTLAVSNVLDRALGHNSSSLVVTGSVMGLTGADIGNPGDPLEPGSTRTLPDGTIEVIAGGTDIWNRADGFHYTYQHRVGDFDVRVQVSRLDAINTWSKAGLMVRESLAPNSRNLSVVVTPVGPSGDGAQGANTYQANWRVAPNAPAAEWVGTGSSAGVPYPNAWIRLRREGNIFIAYRGTNGVNWTLFARMNLDIVEGQFPETVYLGLATTSHNNSSNQTTIAHYQNFGRADLPPVFNCLAGADMGGAGDPLEAGSTVFHADDSIEVVAGGTGVGSRTDGFHFTAQTVTGDFDAQVRVSRLGAINTLSQAGLMARESLDAGSRNLTACVTPVGPTTNQNTGANVYQFLYRPSQDGDTANLGESSGVPYPDAWIRLRREGNTFTAYRGTNGTQWTQYAQTTLAVPVANTVYLGLATTAYDNTPGRTTAALYRNYSVFPAPPVDLRPRTTHVGGAMAFSTAATAPDAPWKTLTYSLEPGAPAGAALDPASGLFTWTPSEAQAETTNVFTVRVSDDGNPSLSATQSIMILVFNHAPVIAAVTPQVAQQNRPYAFQLQASDAESDTLTWSILDGPPGLLVEPASGLLTWTPGSGLETVPYSVRVRATDNGHPAKSGETTFLIRLLSADTLAEIQFDPSAYAPNTILASNSLGPDWFNTRGRIVRTTDWATNPYQMACRDWTVPVLEQVAFFLQSQRVSRDQEVDFWEKYGMVYLRLTEDGTAITFYFALFGEGQLSIFYSRGVSAALENKWGDPVVLYSTNNLAALIPGYRETPTDGDFFTAGVEGFDIYAKHNGREFLRFKDYRHVKAGAVALKPLSEYGIRATAARFKADKPLFSDPAANMLDLRDFGLRSVQVTGSIAAGSTQLVLNASPEPPFKSGDWIIVETGAEAGRGQRGTLGVGGVWPKLHYANPAARDADTSQPNNTYCWTETDGYVRQWDGSAWLDRAHFLDGTNVVENFYVAKAMPKALRAVVTQVASNALTLTLDEPAQASVTNAPVHFDNAPVLNLLSRQPYGYVPTNITLVIPSGGYAMGDPLWLRTAPSCGIRGAGTNLTRLFSPAGTPSATVCISYSSNAFVESLHLQGNDREDGCGLAWYNPRGSGESGVTETQADAAAGRGGVQLLYGCDADRVRDVLITDAPNGPWGLGALTVFNSSDVIIERVRIERRLPARGPGAMVGFAGCKRLAATGLQVLSDRLAQGLFAWNLQDVEFRQVQGHNVLFKLTDIRGNVAIRDSRFEFDPLAQEGQSDYWASTSTWQASILEFAFNGEYTGLQILVENVVMEQPGYLNRRQESLRGIICGATTDGKINSLRVIGGSYSSPDYVPGTGGNAGIGVTSFADSTWIEGFRVSGLAGLGGNGGGNIFASHGVITNSWADDIRPFPDAQIINCWTITNLAPVIGRLIESPTRLLTQSSVLGASGNPIEPGSTVITNDLVELVAGGQSAGNLDAGRYVWTEMTGDYDVAVRVESLRQVNAQSCAGIMIRRNLGAGSPQANIQLSNIQLYNGYNNSWVQTFFRTLQGQSVVPNDGAWTWDLPNVWLRLRKEGSRITTFTGSTHGWIWRTNASFDLPGVLNSSSNSTLLGLYASSEDNTAGQTTRAVFRDLRLINLSPLPVQQVDENTSIRFTLPAVDFNNPLQQLSWSLTPESPVGATIDANTGDFSWTPTEAQGPSTNIVTVRVTDNGTPSLSATQSFSVVVREVNTAPVLTVPVDQTVNELTTLNVSASASDADVPANTLTFGLVAGPSGLAVNPASGAITWTPTEAQGPSSNSVVVRVSDNGTPSLSATNSFTVVVREVNTAPVLTVPTNATVNELATLTVTNAASDADVPANVLTYELLAGPVGMSLNPTTGVLTWTPTEAQGPSSNVVTVRVFDDGMPTLSATQSFSVVVREVNTGPVLTVPVDQTINELTALNVSASATDVDVPANTLAFGLVSGPSGLTVNPTSGAITWTPTEAQGPSTNLVTVRVFDDGVPSLSTSNSFTVVVHEVNTAPVLAAIGDQTVNEETTLTVTNTATDADLPANLLTFELLAGPSGVGLNPTSGVLTWTPSEAQGPSTNVVTVRVFDNGLPSLSATNSFTVVVLEVNTAPVLTMPVDQVLNELDTLTVTNTAVDADIPINTLVFALVSAPVGMVLDPNTGVLTWTPSEAQGPGTNVVTVRVSDNGTPSLSATNSFTVVVHEVNTAPVLTVPVDQTVNELTALAVSASATDADVPANALAFGLVAGPSGLAVNPASGAITWTPTEAQGPSTNFVTVRVSDNGTPGLSATNSFTVVVREVNTAPVFAVPTNLTVNELATLTMTNVASDADLPANALTYELLAGPVGMSLNPATGVLTWTPTEAQGPSSNAVTVRVFDDGVPSLSATQSFSVVVREVNTGPVLTVPVDQTINELTALNVSASATDVDVPANTLAFGLVSGPSGLTVNPMSGAITWTPTEAQGPSTNLVTVRVFDDGVPSLSATNSFTVVVREVNTAPVLTVPADAIISELVSYSANATAADADIPTNLLSFTLVSGPAGLAISPSGAIAWTPAENQGPSTNLVTVRVFDDGIPSLSATNSFTVIVRGAVVPPVINLDPATGLSGGVFRFRFSGTSGQRYVIQKSDNLIGWTDLLTNTMGSSPLDFFEKWETNTHQRFFRVFGLP